MAPCNSNVVKRSNVLLGYAPKLDYREAVLYPGFMAGFNSTLGLIVFGTALMLPPLQWVLRKFVLPKPGEGPKPE